MSRIHPWLVLPLLLAGCGLAAPPLPEAQRADPAAAALERRLVVPHLDQAAIFPAARRLIEGARSDIQLDMFFMGGRLGAAIADALIAKQRSGVEVKVLYDPGMGYTPAIKRSVEPVMRRLAEGGVEARPYPVGALEGAVPIKANHNKMLLVDGRTALVGGMNFADVNAPNHDLMLEAEGPAVRELKRVFKRNWVLAGGDETDLLGSWQAPPVPTTGEHVLATTSGLYGEKTRPHLERLIDGAQKRIWLQMFILADDALCDRLIAASRRGVDVRVLVDPNKFAFALELKGMPNLGAVHKFQGTPIRIGLYDTAPGEQMHIKSCLFDEAHVAAGSTNWTQAGLDTNNEVTLIVESRRLNRELAALFEHDWQRQDRSFAQQPGQVLFRGAIADWISFLF